MFTRKAALLAIGALFVTAGCDMRPRPFPSVFGSNGCRYNDSTFAHGSTACQSGTEYRCEDGQWKGGGAACSDNQPVGRACSLNGNSYSAGSASCQAGTQYRCDDGSWKNLSVACVPGREPAAPGGGTCLYNGATVATQSSICKSGITFLCEDGEWRNLGSACR